MHTLSYLLYRLHSGLSRKVKRTIFFSIDSILFILAISVSYWLRFGYEDSIDLIFNHGQLIPLMIVIKLIVFVVMGMYRPILRYAGLEFLYTATKSVLLSYAILICFAFVLQIPQFPRSVLLNDAVLTLLFVVGIRLVLRWLVYMTISKPDPKAMKVVIYGAGNAGSQLVNALSRDHRYQMVAFVDDNVQLHRQIVNGKIVYPPSKLRLLHEQSQIDAILLAIPSASKTRKREIYQEMRLLNIPVKTVPGISDFILGKVDIHELRNIDITDLLGREEVLPDIRLMKSNISGKSVLVTGAGGSIGSELCRQIAQLEPSRLVLLERNELAMYTIDMELQEHFSSIPRVTCLGSVLDSAMLSQLIREYQIQTIYHAAAYKHVPLVEINPVQGLMNNVFGTLAVAKTALALKVESCILISTDKAVRPSSIMGASKRIAEMILQSFAHQSATATRFAMVRFGNVLDSAGSVVPRFRKQILERKPLTVTHPDITRYFMSIPEAARLVIQAGAFSKGGDVFLLDMGEPVKIYDLAVQMLEMNGLKAGKDIDIIFTGLRPGEKLYEELLIDRTNAQATDHPKIFMAKENFMLWEQLGPMLDRLYQACQQQDVQILQRILQEIVPEYQPKAIHPVIKSWQETASRLDPESNTRNQFTDDSTDTTAQDLSPKAKLKHWVALGRIDEVDSLLKQIGAELPAALNHYFQGTVYGNREESRLAMKCYMKALSAKDSLQDLEDRHYVYVRATRALAITKCKLGEDYQGAIALLDELFKQEMVQQDFKLKQQILTTMAAVHLFNGEYQLATQQLQNFIDHFSEINHISYSQAFLMLALSHAYQKEFEQAEHSFQMALHHFTQISPSQLTLQHFYFGWIGWIPLTLQLNRLFPVLDRCFPESAHKFQNLLNLYQELLSSKQVTMPITQELLNEIMQQLQSLQKTTPLHLKIVGR